MRLEATVPDSRGLMVQELVDELGLSRSQIVDEALSLFLKAVIEIRRGRRLMTMDPQNLQTACELATPTLTAIEWALNPGKLELRADAVAKLVELHKSPKKASARLRAAAVKHRR